MTEEHTQSSTSEPSKPQDNLTIDSSQLASFAACISGILNEPEANAPKASMGDLVNLMETHAPFQEEAEQKRTYGAMLCEKEMAAQRSLDEAHTSHQSA